MYSAFPVFKVVSMFFETVLRGMALLADVQFDLLGGRMFTSVWKVYTIESSNHRERAYPTVTPTVL